MLERKVSRPSFLESLGSKLYHEEPVAGLESGRASVAVIFNIDDYAELLLMKRVVREGDPWAGQVAFPGGRVEPKDSNFRETAIRETSEEMGIDLRASSRFLGYLGMFTAMTHAIMVVPSVFLLTKAVRINPNQEVSSYRWVPLSLFHSDSNRSSHLLEKDGVKQSFPSYVIGDYVIWGLTERIISTLANPSSSL